MKKQLEEINIMRPVLITVFLILYHAFGPWTLVWKLPDGTYYSSFYKWIGWFNYSFLLETFVFISGYVFAFQIYELKRKYTFKEILSKKFKRLIIPSIIFSIINYLIFFEKPSSAFNLIYRILCGEAHIWFLPMLFWCFIISFFIIKLNIKEEYKLIVLLILSLCSFIPLPLRLKETCYYLLFFHLGTYIFNNKELIIDKLANKKFIIISIILFLITFIITKNIFNYIYYLKLSFPLTILRSIGIRICQISHATLGLLTFYIISIYITTKRYHIPEWLIKINPICMGIYLLHHIILKIIYYKTNIPSNVGTILLPWIGYVITLFTSIILATILSKTKIGRFLIG